MRLPLAAAMLAFLGCGTSAGGSNECIGTTETEIFRPNAKVTAPSAPDPVFDPQMVVLTSSATSRRLELLNAGSGCLQIYDVEIVQTSPGALAFTPGRWWFESAVIAPYDTLPIEVEWLDVNDGQDEGSIVMSTNAPQAADGIFEIPLTTER